jgi:hypothetical protein
MNKWPNAVIDMKLADPVMRTVFASMSPGGGLETCVPLRRLLLVQAPPHESNAGPPIGTSSFILIQEQLLNLSVICPPLGTQVSVGHSKIEESSCPLDDGGFTADKSFLEHAAVGLVHEAHDGRWEKFLRWRSSVSRWRGVSPQ